MVGTLCFGNLYSKCTKNVVKTSDYEDNTEIDEDQNIQICTN